MPFDSRISYQSENKLFCISKSLFLRRSVSAKSTEKPLSVLISTLPSFASFGTEAKGMRSIFSLSSMITAKSPSIRSSEYFNPIPPLACRHRHAVFCTGKNNTAK